MAATSAAYPGVKTMNIKPMQWLGALVILVCLHVSGVFTAAEYPAYEHAETEPTSLERETFDVLKRRFPGEILDEKLKRSANSPGAPSI